MTHEQPEKASQLLRVLRECVGVVQMIVFKELRSVFAAKYPDADQKFPAMLAGSILGVLFNTEATDERFILFKKGNTAHIEQELICLPESISGLREIVTDALRIQILCDQQEGMLEPQTKTLRYALELGILIEDRDVPLPSSFVTLVRQIGQQHGLITPPSPPEAPETSHTIH